MEPVRSERTRNLTHRLADLTQEALYIEETMIRQSDTGHIRHLKRCGDQLFDALAHLRCINLLLTLREERGGEKNSDTGDTHS